eukprot:TRINITY_DN15038_c0_g1_i1.p2 TRINITY_DN15038_c0_g1~~TRINITY_DN15038_c0_g1_i1.p2  ORF type:complete len:102 (+),score=8.19 TRINITY_DN15038_c0_g1_i1:224-529(+)
MLRMDSLLRIVTKTSGKLADPENHAACYDDKDFFRHLRFSATQKYIEDKCIEHRTKHSALTAHIVSNTFLVLYFYLQKGTKLNFKIKTYLITNEKSKKVPN